jgi:hypothetical protein
MGTGIVCLAGSDVGSPETVTVDNPSTSASRTIFILLDGWSTGSGPVDITVTTAAIPPPAYTIAPIPAAACDDMTGATDLLSSTTTPTIADDVTTGVRALAFPFSFFGSPVTHYSAQTNGMVQFYSSATGTPSNEWTNADIPSAVTPNGYAAPFWNDLFNITGSVVRVKEFGSGTTRYSVVEWVNQVGTATNFQMKWFETTNVVEFHYCAMGATTSSSATIGLENATGTNGAKVSFNQAGNSATGTGWSFTP